MLNRANKYFLVCCYIFILSVSVIPLSVFAQGMGKIQGVVVDRSTGSPLEYAKVFVLETKYGAVAKEDGGFEINLPVGDYNVQVRFIGYSSQTEFVNVKEDATTSISFSMPLDLIQANEVIVTGTRRKDGARVTINTPVPVDVVSGKELVQNGYSETSQMLQMLVPSFNFPRPSIADGTDHVRPPSLRSLSPDQVLVLINGKRRHASALLNVNGSMGRGSASVDLNAIPSSIIERIEVLRDGASAQYGSDAIAGVINIILKNTPSFNFNASYGGNIENVYTTNGVTDKGTLGDGQVFKFDANGGIKIGSDGFFTYGAEFRFRDSTNRGGEDWRQQFSNDVENSASRESTFDRFNHWVGDPKVFDGLLSFNAKIPLLERWSLYAFGVGNYRLSRATGFYRLSNNSRNTRYKDENDAIKYIYPDGFLPNIVTSIWDGSVNAGIDGQTVDGWLINAGVGYGQNSLSYFIENSLNVSLGKDSPLSAYSGSLYYRQATLNFDINKLFDIGLPLPMSASGGIEARIENYEVEAGEENSYVNGMVYNLKANKPYDQEGGYNPGIQVFPGFKPSNARSVIRGNISGYLDFEQEVIEDLLSLGLAGRLEYYSTFGFGGSGKFSFRLEPIQGYAIRGAISNGFRAPSLQQTDFSSTSTTFIEGIPFDVGQFPVETAAAKGLGAVDLVPERSINISAGLALSPIENLSITLDYFHITIFDRIILSSNYTGAAIVELLKRVDVNDIGGGRYMTNAVSTATNGFDVVVRYGFDFGRGGQLRLTGTFNYTISSILSIKDSPSELKDIKTPLFDHVEQVRIVSGQPRGNLNLMASYDIGGFSIIAKLLSSGDYTVGFRTTSDSTFSANSVNNYSTGTFVRQGIRYQDVSDVDQVYSRKWTVDLEVAYAFDVGSSTLRLAIGGNNIFNVYPDRTTTLPGNTSDGFYLPYDRSASPFGFNGAHYYGKISLSL